MAESNKSDKLTYFLIGLGVGAAGALLIAPKLGKDMGEGVGGVASLFASKFGRELRDRIDETTRNGLEAAHEIANELAEKGREMAADLVSRAEETVARTTERLSSVIEEATETFVKTTERFWEAIDVAKQAYVEEKHKAGLINKGEEYHGTSSI